MSRAGSALRVSKGLRSDHLSRAFVSGILT